MIHQLEINDGVIPPRSIEQWKLLFVRGNPLGLDYTISLDRERAIAQLADSDDETETTKDGPIATSEEKVDNEPVAAVSSAEPPAPANVLSVIDAIDEQEFANYLGNKNSWSGGNSGEEEKNAVLSKVVDGLFEVMSKQEVKVHTTTLSKFPLKLMFLGKRFSGKHSIAVKLAEYCSLKVIEVDQAVQEAIR